METVTPFPRMGEVLRTIAIALDTRSQIRAQSDKKALDRFAKEAHFDFNQLESLCDISVIQPLKEIDPQFSPLLDEYLRSLFPVYANLIARLPVDALNRPAVVHILQKDLIGPSLGRFLRGLDSVMPTPPWQQLLDATEHPVRIVLNWFQNLVSTEIDVTPEDIHLFLRSRYAPNTHPDEVRAFDDWYRQSIPSFSSIKRLVSPRARTNQEPSGLQAWLPLLGSWLVLARALCQMERLQEEDSSLRKIALRWILAGTPTPELVQTLSAANAEASGANRETIQRILKQAKAFSPDRDRSSLTIAEGKAELDRLKQLSQNIPIAREPNYLDQWMKARHQVFAGKLKPALHSYQQAFSWAAYRAGRSQIFILKELLMLAGTLRDKVCLRQHYGWLLIFGENNDSGIQPELWEIDQWASNFRIQFPPSSQYKDAEPTRLKSPRPGLGAYLEDDIKHWSPNLKRPDQVTNLAKQGLRKPQLVWAALFNKTDAIKRLLNAGANPNVLSDQGESALCIALGGAAETQSQQRTALDLLLAYRHSTKTLNTPLLKKRETCLQRAIDLGDPTVVSQLLDMGADPNQPCSHDQLSPLYYLINRFAVAHQRYGLRLQFLNYMNSETSAIDPKVLRRSNPIPNGVMSDRDVLSHARELMKDEQNLRILDAVFTHNEQHLSSVDLPSLRRIAQHLLNHGANPNAVQPPKGSSSVQFSAEVGDVELYDLLIAGGGNVNCIPSPLKIATHFDQTTLIKHLTKQT